MSLARGCRSNLSGPLAFCARLVFGGCFRPWYVQNTGLLPFSKPVRSLRQAEAEAIGEGNEGLGLESTQLNFGIETLGALSSLLSIEAFASASIFSSPASQPGILAVTAQSDAKIGSALRSERAVGPSSAIGRGDSPRYQR